MFDESSRSLYGTHENWAVSRDILTIKMRKHRFPYLIAGKICDLKILKLFSINA